MLPNILTIAQKYGLEADPKTYDKKEVRFKCPFCSSNKHTLSLNSSKGLFKCWRCEEHGGVIKFESLLSGKSFNEIKKMYFGEKMNKKRLHPAYKLTPSQLREIGWYNVKREDFQNFLENKDKIYHDWKKHAFQELVKYYALLVLIVHYPIKEHQKYLYAWFLEVSKKSTIENLSEILLKEWNSKNKKRWAIEGTKLARAIYKNAYKTKNFINILANVLIALEIKGMYSKNFVSNTNNK